jgi:glucokinase
MDPKKDKRIVLTLDAGGTNFVFSAIQANEEICEAVTLPSNGHNLELCINTMEEGFRTLLGRINEKPVAISFAFPGPSDYTTGVIGKLNNLPAFTGNVPLGSILSHRFKLPVFINNDGDLFAYGEALSGFIPHVNQLLQEAGIKKAYHNLIGLTLGTGFGGGIVCHEQLLKGDNSMAGEVWLMRNRLNPKTNVEEGISIRAIRRVYAREAGIALEKVPEPKVLAQVANGEAEGNKKAAIEAFNQLGTVLGDALSNLLTVIDGAVVIGGGLAGAMPLIYPAMQKELQGQFMAYSGKMYPRLVQKVYFMDQFQEQSQFLDWKSMKIDIPDTADTIQHYTEARIPLGTSVMGTNRAVALGAYAYALKRL